MHWIYLIHKFHNLSWITEINKLFHDILIYWDVEICLYISLCWYTFINDLRYKSSEIMHTVFRDSNSQYIQRKSLAPFKHTVFTGKLSLRDHVWTVPFQKLFWQSYSFYGDVILTKRFTKLCLRPRLLLHSSGLRLWILFRVSCL